MCKLIKVLNRILNEDWRGLLRLLTQEEVENNHISISLNDYKLTGHYETDAKHVYPIRVKLIKFVIKKALDAVET